VQSKHPGVELKIVDSGAQALEERLLNGDLEVAIYCRPDAGRNEKLHYMALFREQFMIVLHPRHELAAREAVRAADLSGQRYLNRASCEFYHTVGPMWRQHGFLGNDLVYTSERDDWILAMIASGLGFGFMTKACANHPMVVVRPLVDPECWREVDLVTVRGRPHSPAVGALVREAMRTSWFGGDALAVRRERARVAVD
jgi:DNA-binding transcriptional LysR family regulator